jgi:uncharacterized protein YkwD
MKQDQRNCVATPLLSRQCHNHDAAQGKLSSGLKVGLHTALLCALLCVSALPATIPAASADPLTTINAIRTEGCADGTPSSAAVAQNDALDAVARELSQSSKLNEALEATGYPAGSAAGVYARGPLDDASFRAFIKRDYCQSVSNPEFNEVGLYRSGDEMWMVLAARLDLPELDNASAVAQQVLELVNAARDEPRQCGDRSFDATSPVVLSTALTSVALLHAQDMARQRIMDHRGSDGSQPGERLTRSGYRWRTVGENVAAGQPNASEVVESWLASPGHCSAIMEPRFEEMGVAFALVAGNPAIYWAQTFAAPLMD